jgi:hypothetical protein
VSFKDHTPLVQMTDGLRPKATRHRSPEQTNWGALSDRSAQIVFEIASLADRWRGTLHRLGGFVGGELLEQPVDLGLLLSDDLL